MSSVGISARCTICTSEFHRNNISALPCGHTFHYDCVMPWLKNAKSCPNCRFRIPNNNAVIKQLFFDSEDASQSAQEERDYAAEAEELAIKLQKERDDHFKTKEEQRKLAADRDSIKNEFNRINTKYQKEVPRLQSENSTLWMRVEDRDDVERRLKETRKLLNVSEFYNFVVGHKNCQDEEANIEKLQTYLTAGEMDTAKFIALLKSQMKDLQRQNKTINNDFMKSEKMRREQMTKVTELENTVNMLTNELNDTRASCKIGSPFNPKLKPFLNRSPAKRISMGFNQTIDLNEDVVNSALRKPLQKVRKRTADDGGVFDDFPSDRISMNAEKSSEPPVFDLNDTFNDSDLSLPPQLLERVKAGPSRKLTNPMGAIPSAAMRALANMENQNVTRPMAPKPVKMMKKTVSGKATEKKTNSIAQFFKKTKSNNDIIDLD